MVVNNERLGDSNRLIKKYLCGVRQIRRYIGSVIVLFNEMKNT